MFDWMRALKLRWLVAIVLGWWATVLAVLVVVVAFTLFPSVHWSANGVEGDLVIVDRYFVASAEQLIVLALAAPLPFAFLWLLLRLVPRHR